jgi:hypothetical protein
MARAQKKDAFESNIVMCFAADKYWSILEISRICIGSIHCHCARTVPLVSDEVTAPSGLSSRVLHLFLPSGAFGRRDNRNMRLRFKCSMSSNRPKLQHETEWLVSAFSLRPGFVVLLELPFALLRLTYRFNGDLRWWTR